MKVRVKKTGRVVDGAEWFGFNHWIRAWVDEGPGDRGWMHWHASEVEILERGR
jgi:hypothetical protein